MKLLKFLMCSVNYLKNCFTSCWFGYFFPFRTKQNPKSKIPFNVDF